MTRLRLLLLFAIAACAVAVVARLRSSVAAWPTDVPAVLAWVATARQFGPVSYRDPAGAISPDGQWIAYSEGRFLRIRPAAGGAIVDLPPNEAQIRNLAWSPDSRTIIADGYGTQAGWAIYDRADGTRHPLWPDREDTGGLRQLAWSKDGRSLTAIVNGANGPHLVTRSAAGAMQESSPAPARAASPVWTPDGKVLCIAAVEGHQLITMPCGGAALPRQPSADAYGPLAVSPDGSTVYASYANRAGTVDLWAVPLRSGGEPHRLTSFARDTYAPSVAADGTVVFKVQSYRTHVAIVPADGGASRPLAIFQSETPSWDPTGKWIGITFGTWRRVPDDAKYPDIAQDAGVIASDAAAPAASPSSVVHDSVSEDQSLCWSPNGQWIAFHSHKEQSDDIWLRRASGDAAARRLTMLGRGAEAGWPRWSRDGRWLLFTGANRHTKRNAIYVVGLDQERGEMTAEAKTVETTGVDVDVLHAEWLDDGAAIAAIGKEGPGRHVIFTVPRGGGAVRVLQRVASEHDFPGLAVSPDGKDVAYIAPASDGFFQIFRMPIGGGPARQITSDPSNKTQPAWSPDRQRIAFTVWSYEAQFWRLAPR